MEGRERERPGERSKKPDGGHSRGEECAAAQGKMGRRLGHEVGPNGL
jgi:hypothetical protein